jgi:hypothetical protein
MGLDVSTRDAANARKTGLFGHHVDDLTTTAYEVGKLSCLCGRQSSRKLSIEMGQVYQEFSG